MTFFMHLIGISFALPLASWELGDKEIADPYQFCCISVQVPPKASISYLLARVPPRVPSYPLPDGVRLPSHHAALCQLGLVADQRRVEALAAHHEPHRDGAAAARDSPEILSHRRHRRHGRSRR